MTLTVGRISYLNVVPFFHRLDLSQLSVRIVDGVPSELNDRLAAGELDLAPSSSFEYARHWQDYLLLPGLSISSLGPVRSVLLFSRRRLEEVAGEDVALTGESATSVNLLQVLLREFHGAEQVRFRLAAGTAEELIAAGDSVLMIGDRALRAARRVPPGVQVYDLGEVWYRFTGLPFVFALWIVRRSAFSSDPQGVRKFRRELEKALAQAFADLPGMAAAVVPGAPLPASELVAYWRDSMSYRLNADHLDGLRLFFTLCRKYGLLDEEPELRFVD